MTDTLLTQLASTGVVGVILVLSLLALRSKDRELKAEMAARITDAVKFNDMSLALQREVIAAVGQLGKIVIATQTTPPTTSPTAIDHRLRGGSPPR